MTCQSIIPSTANKDLFFLKSIFKRDLLQFNAQLGAISCLEVYNNM